MNNEETTKKIKEMIENIRPFLQMDGGDIEFIKYEDNYLYVRLNGHCTDCLFQDDTINNNLLLMFQEEMPVIEGIINVPL